jgi:hypothetical protein
MGNGKLIVFAFLMLLFCAVMVFYGCSDDGADFFGTDGNVPKKEYRIVGDSGTFRVEVRKSQKNWQLLGEGLKSRESCNEIIDQDFTNGR